MNSTDSSSPTAAPAAFTEPQINVFNWLLVLGFPADVAAAVARPDTFTR